MTSNSFSGSLGQFFLTVGQNNFGNKISLQCNFTLGKTVLPVRWMVAVLAFFGFVFNYMLRVNINLTIVSMVNYTQDENDTDNINECNRVKTLYYITFYIQLHYML